MGLSERWLLFSVLWLGFALGSIQNAQIPSTQSAAPLSSDIIAVGLPYDGNPSIVKYSIESNEWTVIATLNEEREYFGAALLKDRVIIAGGDISGNQIDSVVSVDLKTKTISNLAPLSKPTDELSLIEFNGFVYAVGGYVTGFGTLSSVDRYDPASNEWQSVAAMSTGRRRPALVQFNGSLCAIGGWLGENLNSVECYDASTDSWTTKASMIKPRQGAIATAVNGYIYVAGGIGESKPRTIERYDPTTDSWTVVDTLESNDDIEPRIFRDGDLFAFNKNYGSFNKYNLGTKEWKGLAALNGRDDLAVFLTTK